METVVLDVAVQTQLFSSGQADPVLAGGLAAAVADVRGKDPGSFRKGNGDRLYIKHFLRGAALIVGKGFGFRHFGFGRF